MSDWYKDAVFYEVHVKAFMDADGNGVGDFAGLTGKLDYLHDLGVDCLWILPMYPSPTSTASTRRTAASRTSRSSSTPPTIAACASSPTS